MATTKMRWAVLAVIGIASTMVLGCADEGAMNGQGPEATQTLTTSDTVTHVGTAVGTSTITVTATQIATTTPTATATSTATPTATGTVTTSTTATATTTATPSATNTATATSTTSKSGTATATSTTSVTTTATMTSVITTGTRTATYTQTVTTIAVYGAYTSVRRSLPPLWACPAGAGAGGSGGGIPSPDLPTSANLAASDCSSLANLRRPILKAQSQSQLDQARASLIAAYCSDRTETVCLDGSGTVVSSYNCGGYGPQDAGVSYGYGGRASSGGANTAGGMGGAAGSTGATTYSTTNTQVASVDEADYVKNDGNSIFVLSSDGLHVIDAWPAGETHEVAHLTLPGTPRRLYFSDNRLVVYSRILTAEKTNGAGASNPSDQGCTYGYSCRFSSEGGHTLIQVFDVTVPATPTELIRYELSGGYVDSRRIGSNIYTVVHDTGANQVPGLSYSLSATSYDDLQAKYAQVLAANFALIDASQDDFFLPWTTTTKPGGTAAYSSGCQYALATQYSQGASFVSINTFDLTTLQQPTRTILASNAGYVYASTASLYMAVDRTYEQNYTSTYTTSYSSYQANDSFVHKFSLSGTDAKYVGSVALPGHILNQFAMDEADGVLRVASTKGWVPDPTVESFLTTFGLQAGKLVQLGQVGGIGPKEDIRAVRFDGNRGFVVTFKKTDPLFVFDLTDATKPTLMGELQIPGFSTYMQRLDDTHMLAIGFTADDHESFAYFNGIQIQIFDVADLANPKLAWKYVIGTRGSSSEALTNHLAFNYFAPQKMLALPITVCEGGGNGSYATNMTFAGLMAFDISLDAGITEHGRLPFVDPKTVSASANCDNWWTDSKSLVKRSIFMDDYVYGLSDAQLRVAALSSMSTVLQSVPLVSK